MTVVLTGLTERQRQSWLGLLDVAADFPNGWCLVGGQMVHLYCQERGVITLPAHHRRRRRPGRSSAAQRATRLHPGTGRRWLYLRGS